MVQGSRWESCWDVFAAAAAAVAVAVAAAGDPARPPATPRDITMGLIYGSYNPIFPGCEEVQKIRFPVFPAYEKVEKIRFPTSPGL